MEHRSIANEFEAGRLVGQTLLEVVLLLTIVWDGVGLAAKGAKALGELPELPRLSAGVAKENLQKVPKLARIASGVTREKAEGLLKALREKLRTGGGGTVEETSAAAPRPESGSARAAGEGAGAAAPREAEIPQPIVPKSRPGSAG